MHAVLEVKKGIGVGGRYELREGKALRAGRDTGNEIVLSDLAISRAHCVFELNDEVCTVRDMGGVNGTFVNRTRVQEAELADGDLVVIGKKSLIRVRMEGVEVVEAEVEPEAVAPEPPEVQDEAAPAAAEEDVFNDFEEPDVADEPAPLPGEDEDSSDTETAEVDEDQLIELEPGETLVLDKDALGADPLEVDPDDIPSGLADMIEMEPEEAEPAMPDPLEPEPFEMDEGSVSTDDAQGGKKKKGGIFGKLARRKKGEDADAE